jgi:hypothetical protein
LYLKRNRTPERAVQQHLLHNINIIIDVNNNKKKMPSLPTTMISSLLLSLGVICVLLVSSSSAASSPMTIKPPNLVLATNSCEICEVGT